MPAAAADIPIALKDLEARYATKWAKDYKLTDGEGLYLLVRPNGSKLWRFKYRFVGKEKLLSFGQYPRVGLADARLRGAEAKVALGGGWTPVPRISPTLSRHASRPPALGTQTGSSRSTKATPHGF